MAYEEITSLLGGRPGFVLVGVTREPASAPDKPARIILELAPAPEAVRHCSRCGQAVAEVHEVTSRLMRDLPILDADTWLKVPPARLACPRCGPTVEAIPWLDRYARVTRRFAESVARLCRLPPTPSSSRDGCEGSGAGAGTARPRSAALTALAAHGLPPAIASS